ncbi:MULTISPECIES: sulfur carrier protein ThiS [Fusobacterium]|uniref:Thiamine biosynthesis protein ThiS n=1 Tax=Fusobacterium equinum TaxID=134605 RepID=A0A133NB22_9FUSO|nr:MULTISPECIES: sulfur carrier protein ThiS [Fusobacterium]AVQ16719.1 thiamine biosynthesis protein ThiS [Fusobacterium gonidiaformans ATCC 25563]EFS28293.1 thiamine biosynthesis protein ThiS [Fusobacterium gonidiaformans ATCC 25563]KXA13497.1 thiamine biosynthesis protein ThiS [Fusobacterium equinum]
MQVTINGLDREIPENMNILTLVEKLSAENNISLIGAIVLIDEELIPKATWEKTFPKASSKIEVLSFVSGG